MKPRSLVPSEDTRPVAVVLLSGGLDSAVALAHAAETYRCVAVLVDYGQPHGDFELTCARVQAGRCNAEVVPLDLSRLRLAQTGGVGVSPHYVPGRNGILLALAFSVAETKGAACVVIGATAEDALGFPDCRPAYLDAVQTAARLGMARAPELVAPLSARTKAEVIHLGLALGVDIAATRSCYAATAAPCGLCGACVTRAKGFEAAGVTDPATSVGVRS